MHKIIFEFSETVRVLDDITITVEATNAEILIAATVLIDELADSIQKDTKKSKEYAQAQALTMLQKALGNTREKARTDNNKWEISNE